ncbi:MurR/RpiR family transcriptional regulator [Spiroplasma taiwanense]|uniref:HTH rpiR-type domain-containing protein n=1 Tax=Spiroplasma taiwanense CT-1 TaxID=1276220 RepID=S5MGR5_9MOLU|nr:hypothetical protein [Spiroplasma taiwanense]AGR41040.1 hypothetical protein STAIW_v1c03900 [Spiroplasma taiwanense CT-1]
MLSVYERVENLIKDNKNTTFKLIGKQILTDWNIGVFKTQNEISETCFVSLATVTQFAKACLCEGYKELIIRLRVEYENVMQNSAKVNLGSSENKNQMINIINDWVEQNDEFISDLAAKIMKVKKLWICPSFQGMYSAKFLEDALTNLGIQAKLIDLSINLEIAKHVDFRNELIVVLLTGRDTETTIRTLEYLIQFKNEVFIITTPSNIIEWPEIQNQKHMLVNFQDNNFFYKYRSYALITLFFSLTEKISI